MNKKDQTKAVVVVGLLLIGLVYYITKKNQEGYRPRMKPGGAAPTAGPAGASAVGAVTVIYLTGTGATWRGGTEEGEEEETGPSKDKLYGSRGT